MMEVPLQVDLTLADPTHPFPYCFPGMVSPIGPQAGDWLSGSVRQVNLTNTTRLRSPVSVPQANLPLMSVMMLSYRGET